MTQPNPEMYEQAAVLLAERGHAKGVFEEADGSLCLAAAINVAAGCKPNGRAPKKNGTDLIAQWARGRFARWLVERGEVNTVLGLTCWNDKPGRTKEEVTAALRDFAAELKAGA